MNALMKEEKKFNRKVMVCVTRQKSCERLIKYGAAYGKVNACELLVVHALSEEANVLGDEQESQALEWLFDVSRKEGGELLMLRAADVEQAICDCAREHRVVATVLGQSPGGQDDFARRLKLRMPSMSIMVVEAE